MNKFVIFGSSNISGSVSISGSKNSSLFILYASLLSSYPIEINNVPMLKDIFVTIDIFKYIGVKIDFYKNTIYLDASYVDFFKYPCYLCKSTRSSILILGSLLSRFGYVKTFFPGGCNIGSRPIDLHLYVLMKMKSLIYVSGDYIYGYSRYRRLVGTYIYMYKKSVGATVNAILAAVLASGITFINNASIDPEIIDLSNFLIKLGAKINILNNKIFINGVNKLYGGKYSVLFDRMETGTFLVASAISKGKIVCYNTKYYFLKSVLYKLKDVGADINIGDNWISLDMRGKKPKSVILFTKSYPYFPTDLQPQFSLLNSVSDGIGLIIESIFDYRFMHLYELIKMGANIDLINNNVFKFKGVNNLFGSVVNSMDLRSSAALVLAGCIAVGETVVNNIDCHLDRGYEFFEDKLNDLGANIKRI